MKIKDRWDGFLACDDIGPRIHSIPSEMCYGMGGLLFNTAAPVASPPQFFLPTLAHYIQKFIKIFPRAFLLPPSSSLFLLALGFHYLLDSRLVFACKLVGSLLLLARTIPFHSLTTTQFSLLLRPQQCPSSALSASKSVRKSAFTFLFIFFLFQAELLLQHHAFLQVNSKLNKTSI